MTKYLLSQWEAIELFCKVVCKYENMRTGEDKKKTKNLVLDDFKDNKFLLQILRRYENPKYYRTFGDVYMKSIANEEGFSRHYPKALYDLSRQIRHSLPVVRTMDELLILFNFIGEEKKAISYKLLETWLPSDKQRTFENSRWWLYHYQEYRIPNTTDSQPGISRAVVYLKDFAKLIIENIDAEGGEPGRQETYEGQYSIYKGYKDDYLLLECSLAETRARDLHILLDIGDDELEAGEIALGQYHNVNRTIYSGTVILEKVSQRGSLKPAFFKKNDETIPKVYWDFFEDKHKNRIRVKSAIRSRDSLKTWIDIKRRQMARRKDNK